MSELNARDAAPTDARLSRRSLVAAAGVLAAVGPAAASRALAFSNPKAAKFEWEDRGGDKCQTKCAMCFLQGTRLLTPDDEVAIETLKIGDLVATEGGSSRTVRWIGRIAIARAGIEPWSADAQPIRVAANALGTGRPHRDLYLSRAHMVHLNGVLVPVGDLINGSTIAPADLDVAQLLYFHIELDAHDVLLAEGAPCESLLLSAGKLAAFDNSAEYLALYGEPPVERPLPYAPIVSFYGGRGELKSRLRSALAPVVDIRRPLDVVRDDIEARALFYKAA